MERKIFPVKLNQREMENLNRLAVIWQTDKSEAIRRAVREALRKESK